MIKYKKFKKFFLNKTAWIVWVGIFLFFITMPVQAAWPTENILTLSGADLSSALNVAEQKTRSVILARMQQEAIRQIQSTMGDLVVGGNGAGSYVITSYEDFIYGTSQRAGKQMITDLFRDLKEGAEQGLKDQLRLAETELTEELFGGIKRPTLGAFVEDRLGQKVTSPTSAIFKVKDMSAFVEYSKSNNNVTDIKNSVKGAVLSYMNQVRDIQRTKAIANQGFNPRNGIPGSVISRLVASAQSAPIEMISNATSAEQVIDNLATSTLTSFMRTGYNNISIPALNQIQKINKKYEGGVSTIQSLIYEGHN